MKSIYELFQESKQYKANINTEIESWLSQYRGEPYGNEVEGRSSLVWKLIKKQIEVLSSNIGKSFLSQDRICVIEPRTKNDVIKAKIDEKLINFFYNTMENKINLIKTTIKVPAKEGTCFVKVGWKKVTKKHYLDNVSQEEVFQNENILKDDKGFYILQTIKNRPYIDVIPNEDVFTDPLAKSIEDSRFIFIRKEVTEDELRSNPLLDGEKVERWIEEYKMNAYVGSEASADDLHDRELWRIDTNETENEKGKPIDEKIFLYEFWKKEKNKIIVKYLLFNGTQETILTEKELPCKEYPFVVFNLIPREFHIWGEGLASVLEEEQKFMTAIVRGVIDNMAMSNNGQKIIKKGALDSVNLQRLVNNEPVVELNTTAKITDVIFQGSFNELPNSVYNMLQIIERQAEGLTGINEQMQGVGSNVNAPATNFQAMLTQAQIRLNDYLISYQDGWKKIFTKWIKMAMMYLTDEEIYEITGISIADAKFQKTLELREKYQTEKMPPKLRYQVEQLIVKEIEDIFRKDRVQYDIKIKIGTDTMNIIKVQQINMLMQQLAPLVQNQLASPMLVQKLTAKLAELLGFPEIADEIEHFKQPQPDPQQVALQQEMLKTQLMESKAKAMKEEALAKNALARTQHTLVKAKKEGIQIKLDLADKLASVEQKKAQSLKTIKEAQGKDVENKKAYAETLKILGELNGEDRNQG